jgi:hypothetical protein
MFLNEEEEMEVMKQLLPNHDNISLLPVSSSPEEEEMVTEKQTGPCGIITPIASPLSFTLQQPTVPPSLAQDKSYLATGKNSVLIISVKFPVTPLAKDKSYLATGKNSVLIISVKFHFFYSSIF